MSTPSDLGTYLRKLREERRYLLRDVAKKTGYSMIHISEVERGIKNPSDDLLSALAKAYDLPEEEIFFLAGRIPPAFVKEALESKELQAFITIVVKNRDLPEQEKRQWYKLLLDFLKIASE